MLYPKIGIRPVIDGRWGGVRESLEKQTMGMAERRRQTHRGEPALSRRHACAVRHRPHHHRRRRGSGRCGRSVRQ